MKKPPPRRFFCSWNNKMKIVIIGHGPSMKNAKLGAFIDSTDGYVVRLSNRSWQDPLNYGIRTDYVCAVSPAYRMEQIFTESKAKYETWLYYRRGSFFKRKEVKEKTDRLQREGFNPVICMKEVVPWRRRYRKLFRINKEKLLVERKKARFHNQLTKGLVAIVIVAQRLSHVKELLLLGFDNLVLGTTDNFFTYGLLALTNGEQSRKKVEHNYSVERQILDEIISKYKIKLITYEDVIEAQKKLRY